MIQNPFLKFPNALVWSRFVDKRKMVVLSISTPFPKDTDLDLDYTTAVSDQTFDLSLLPRAFDGTARNQTSISTLRLKFDPKTQRCVSKNDPEPIFQMSECSRMESIRGQNVNGLKQVLPDNSMDLMR